MSNTSTVDDPATAVRDASAAYREAVAAVEEYGREELESLQNAYEEMVSLLRQFEDKATGTGAEEFVRTAQVRHSVTNHVEELDDDLPGRGSFERAASRIDKRRLSQSDFSKAWNALDPAEKLVERLETYETTREELKDARETAQERLDAIKAEIDHNERLQELAEIQGSVDLTPLRAPIEQYNDQVRSAFQSMRTDESIRALFELLERAQQYPLVDIDQPPEELREYVFTNDAGTESVTQLLEYADYSKSKLSHYVDDADTLKRRVATQRTVLERLDAEPLTIGWPPPTADVLPWKTNALRSVAAPLLTEEAVAALRELESLARDSDRYEELRQAAAADAELSATDSDRVASGAVAEELESLRTERDRIETALEEAPDP